MGGACCAVEDASDARVEYVTKHLTPEERAALAAAFGTVARPREELQSQWQQFFTDPFSPAAEWAGTWGPASPRCLGGEVVIECWSRYRTVAGEVQPECSLLDFEFVTAEVKVIRVRRRTEAAQKLKTVLSAKGFRQALVHSVSAVVNQLLQDGHTSGRCTSEELKRALTDRYGVDIPAQMLPCQLHRADCGEDYHSAEFISPRELRAPHLLTMIDEPAAEEINYCCKLQAALQEMFPVELGSGVWIGWLHVQEWSEPEACVAILEQARQNDSGAS